VAEKTVKMEQVDDKLAETAKRVDEIINDTEDVKRGIDNMSK
jgi:hypothetical protein